MQIGFDMSQTGSSKAGCGYFEHALIKAMLEPAPEHRYALKPRFGDFYFDALMPIKGSYSGQSLGYGPRHLSQEAALVFWIASDTEALLDNTDIIHANNFWCSTQLQSSRLIYTFYDMGFAIDHSWTTEANGIGCFDGDFLSSIVVDWFVAISEASKEHYLKVFPHFHKDRIRIIYPSSCFAESSLQEVKPKAFGHIIDSSFCLNVGTIEPRKNQHRLTEAYAQYMSMGVAMPLVLDDSKCWLMEDFQKHVKDFGVDSKIIITGYVSDDELIWLYRNCYANFYQSLFEWFGLPVLEGIQFVAATLTSNSTSIPEVAGHAPILLDLKDVSSRNQEMHRLEASRAERESLPEASLIQAKKFQWEVSAKALVMLLEEAMSTPKRRFN